MQSTQDDPQRTVAALMAASRAFVGITARSIAAEDGLRGLLAAVG